MPYKDYPLYLQHIADCIRNIDFFLGDMSVTGMKADRKTEAAVERELQIITEAAIRLGDKADELCPGPDWRNIRGLGTSFVTHTITSIPITCGTYSRATCRS